MDFLIHWMLLQGLVLLCAYPLAKYVQFIQSRSLVLSVEKKFFQYLGISTDSMNWWEYLWAFLGFQFLGWLLVYLCAGLQNSHYQMDLAAAFELASSYVTNTNWISLSGERHWSLVLWLLGVIAQNFLSAASGLTILLVFARCFKAQQEHLGNFWVDIWRMSIYVLLPLSFIAAIPLLWQGVPQNFSPNLVIPQYTHPELSQLLPMGPIAATESIKLLGTNGGGYTFANSAHPFENPTVLTHYEEMVLMLLLPVMGAFLFARIYGRIRYGWYIYAVMLALGTSLVMSAYYAETPYLLGKELRIGSLNSVMWHGITTATSTGATVAIIDQFQPLTIGFYLFLMNLGEIVFGGVGIGVVNLLFLFVLTAFILGLLTGSSPIFLKNKVPLSVIKLSMLYIIFVPCMVLMTLIVSFVMHHPHDLSSIPYLVSAQWYDVASWFNNNGSGFIAWAPSSMTWHYVVGVLMLLGRYIPIILILKVCGIIAHQQILESSKQVIDIDSVTFAIAAVVVIVIVTLLAFLPLWSLGPLAFQGIIEGV